MSCHDFCEYFTNRRNTFYKLSVHFNFVKSLAHVAKATELHLSTCCGFFTITVAMCIVQG